MPSPFPGMDPYLEAPAGWQEFHSRFINTMSDFLVPKVRPKYAVHIERYVYVAEVFGEEGRIRPDIAIVETEQQGSIAEQQAYAVATAVLVPLPVLEEVRHYFLEIREVATQKVITVIEMLSPFNKRVLCPSLKKFATTFWKFVRLRRKKSSPSLRCFHLSTNGLARGVTSILADGTKFC